MIRLGFTALKPRQCTLDVQCYGWWISCVRGLDQCQNQWWVPGAAHVPGCPGTGICPDCFSSLCFHYQWGMRFSYSFLVLEVKQSCLEENSRGLFHILMWSNPSIIPRAMQSFCRGNRECICVHVSCWGSLGMSVLSDWGSSPVCDPGTSELLLQKLGWAYMWQFALWLGFLAWLLSTGAVAHKSSSTMSRTNLEVHISSTC